jgi:hypothetical protein
MITGPITVLYDDYLYVYEEPNRITRIKRLCERTGLTIKEAKWVIDSCIGRLGHLCMEVVHDNGSKANVTFPASYCERTPIAKGETVLLEIISGGTTSLNPL